MYSDVLPAFTCAAAIGNFWSNCLGVNVLSPSPITGNNLLLKSLRLNSQHSQRADAIS